MMKISDDNLELKIVIRGVRLEEVRQFPYFSVQSDDKGTQGPKSKAELIKRKTKLI